MDDIPQFDPSVLNVEIYNPLVAELFSKEKDSKSSKNAIGIDSNGAIEGHLQNRNCSTVTEEQTKSNNHLHETPSTLEPAIHTTRHSIKPIPTEETKKNGVISTLENFFKDTFSTEEQKYIAAKEARKKSIEEKAIKVATTAILCGTERDNELARIEVKSIVNADEVYSITYAESPEKWDAEANRIFDLARSKILKATDTVVIDSVKIRVTRALNTGFTSEEKDLTSLSIIKQAILEALPAPNLLTNDELEKRAQAILEEIKKSLSKS